MIVRGLFCTFLLAATMLCSAQEQADSHQDVAAAMVDFLSRTEMCLNTCRDAASVQAAIPALEELKKEAAALSRRQAQLPEPTVQDYMAAQSLAGDFSTLWSAIRTHIERLETEGLMSDTLRQILHIAPPAPQP
ncbi:MAG: hypothetical protein IKK45_05960 [Akkermansia sp.]|nr:hypothetical protein [Akkermansia sp.]